MTEKEKRPPEEPDSEPDREQEHEEIAAETEELEDRERAAEAARRALPEPGKIARRR
jgi:hypothetical protein